MLFSCGRIEHEMVEPLQIAVEDGDSVTGFVYPGRKRDVGAVLLLAPGAGAGQKSGFMLTLAEGLASRGIDVVTFDFIYMEKGRKYPDRAERLEECYEAAIKTVRERLTGKRYFAGGKSMGGRIASQVAASGRGSGLRGLVFLGYPLHPPGKPEKQRSSHLPRIEEPMLFCQGTRDAFGTPDEIRQVVDGLPSAVEIFEVEGGDHSFKVLKRSGLSQEEVLEGVMDRVASWIEEQLQVGRPSGPPR